MCQRPPATAAACLLRPPSVRSVATCFSVSHRSQPSALSNQPEPMICACFSTSLLSCLLVLNRQSIHSYPNLPTDTHATQQRNVWCLFVIFTMLSIFYNGREEEGNAGAHCTKSAQHTLIVFNLKQVKSTKPINYADANSC